MADHISLLVHRCRFVDFHPSAITALAFPPLPLPNPSQPKPSTSTSPGPKYGVLAVGHANGNIDICEWAGEPGQAQCHQAWVVKKTLPGLYPSKVDSLVISIKRAEKLTSEQIPTIADLRLFSSGGGSELLEWDLAKGCIRRTINSQGGSIWAMSANPSSTLLALGCEDGSVRLLNIAEDALYHQKRFDRAKCRILSVAWGPPVLPERQQTNGSDESEDDDLEWQDSWIVTGGSDSALRKWDVKTGRVLDRMAVDKMKGERTLVWSVATLGDGTIISGDSLGTVKFWDHRTCTQLHSFKGHGADVLCLAIGPDGSSVFSSGVDQKITQYSFIKTSRTTLDSTSKTTSKWVQSSSRRIHSHDVRSLAMWPPYTPLPKSHRRTFPMDISPILASGGLDMSVVATPCAPPQSTVTKVVNPIATSIDTTFGESYHRRLHYVSGPSAKSGLCIARKARLMMSMGDAQVNIWRLPEKSRRELDEFEDGIDDGKENDGWEKVLQMSLNLQTNLIAGAMSDDGRWLAVSDLYETKLFSLTSHDGQDVVPRRIRNFASMLHAQLPDSSSSTGSVALTFTPDSSKVVLSTALSSYVVIVDLSDESSPQIVRCFDQHHQGSSGRLIKSKKSEGVATSSSNSGAPVVANVTRLAVSADRQWLASSDEHLRTHVFNLDSLQYHCALPSFSHHVQALSFDPSRPNLLILVFPNNTFQVYDVEARQFPPWSKELVRHIPGRLTGTHDYVIGITFDPSVGPSSSRPYALLWGATWLCKVELQDTGTGASSKKRKSTAVANAAEHDLKEQKSNFNFKMITHYRPILHVDFLGTGELVVVERPLVDVLAALPPAYFRHKYGAS